MPAIYYVDSEGSRRGPIELTPAIGLIRTGMIIASTLVWSEGMQEWAAADQSPILRDQFTRAPPPLPGPPPPAAAAVDARGTLPSAGGADVALRSTVAAWGLFWRALLLIVGAALIIPSPWTNVMYWRYVATTTRLPNGAAFEFEGRPGDIWWVFVAQAILMWISQVKYGQLPGMLGGYALSYIVIRWFCGALRVRAGDGRLEFKGGFWTNFGFAVLVPISIVTIIGWAWVVKHWMKWLCANVEGVMTFEFVGTGLGILWRTLVFSLASCLILPIPWMIAWFCRWFVSQIRVVRAAAG